MIEQLILLLVSWNDPLYILTHSKIILRATINRDASFLEENNIMDYSLLVGQNSEDKMLVLGIIGMFEKEVTQNDRKGFNKLK